MTDIDVVALRRVGPIEFGIARHEVVRALGPPDVVFTNLSLHYRGFGNLGFDAADRLCFVGTSPRDVTLVIDGLRIEGSVRQVEALLATHGHELAHGRPDAVDGDFSYCDALGLKLGRADRQTLDGPLNAVCVWVPSYWEAQPAGVRSA